MKCHDCKPSIVIQSLVADHTKDIWYYKVALKLHCVPTAVMPKFTYIKMQYNSTTTPPQPLYGPFSGTTWVSQCQKRTSGLYGDFMVQGKINRGRHTDHPAGHHCIRINQCPHPPSPQYNSTGIHIILTIWVTLYLNGFQYGITSTETQHTTPACNQRTLPPSFFKH